MSRPGQTASQPWVFLSPALLLLSIFVLWPLIRVMVWSVQSVSILNPEQASFSGITNYSWMVSDPRFRQAFANTALFALMVVPLQTGLSFFMALWVNRPEPAWRWLRTAFFIPVVIAMPVLAVLWSMMYQPADGGQMGLINEALAMIGLPAQDWLNDPRLALPAIAFMSIWQGVGFQMMIFLAGLQHVSSEQLEAARIDGAGAAQRLWHVLIPELRPTLIFVLITTTILSFRLFVQPYLMTRGGPQGRTVSLVQAIYETTFLSRDLGLASAATVLLLGLVLLVTLIHRWLDRRAEL